MLRYLPFIAAHLLGAVPLIAVTLHGRHLPRVWWLLAFAFGVSFVADTVSAVGWYAYGNPDAWPLVSQTYPMLQAGLFALALSDDARVTGRVLAALVAAAFASALWRDAAGLDLLLHSVAWGSTAWLAWRTPIFGPLRFTLSGGFVALAVAWAVFALTKSPWALGWFHAVRLAMAAGFVVAVREAARAG